jgi:hypothetical protein
VIRKFGEVPEDLSALRDPTGCFAPEAASQSISQRSSLAFQYVQQRNREPPVSRVTRNLAITGWLA